MADTDIVIDENGDGNTFKNSIEVLDYSFDLTNWLANISDSISGVQVFVDDESGINLDSFLYNTNVVLIWISGGLRFKYGIVTCIVTTSGLRTYEFKLKIYIK